MVGPAQDNQNYPSAEPAVSSSPGYAPPVMPQTQNDQMNFVSGQEQSASPKATNEMRPDQAYQPQQQSQQPPEPQPQPQQPQQQPSQQQPLTPPNQGYSGSYRQQQQPAPEPEPTPQDQQASDPYEPYYDDYLPLGPQQEELVYEWKAPSRPFKQHNRQYYTTVGTIVLLLVLILFFAGQILTIAVVLAAAFLTYIMSSIPPHTIRNQITTYGIRTADNLYYWDEMGRFWFKEKHQDKILHVEVARFPERLTILVGEAEEDILRQILSLALLEQEPAPTYYEKAAAWMQEKIPLDIDG